MDAESLEILRSIDARLSAMLAITVEDLLRRTPELATPRPRSIDRLLTDAGLDQGEVAALLGKSPQAVSQQLAKDGKAMKRTPTRGRAKTQGAKSGGTRRSTR
jgi:hypothetical protein